MGEVTCSQRGNGWPDRRDYVWVPEIQFGVMFVGYGGVSPADWWAAVGNRSRHRFRRGRRLRVACVIRRVLVLARARLTN
jgi:hypothetical protein